MKSIKRLTSVILVLMLVFSAVSAVFQGSALSTGQNAGFGTVSTITSDREVGTGVVYNDFYVKGNSGGTQHMYTLSFNPQTSDYMPMAFSQTAGYGAITLDSATQAEALGYDVKGGVNASFFSFTGSSCNTYGGITVSDGKVMHGISATNSSETWLMAFDSAGKASLVKSRVTFSLSVNNGEWTAPIENINSCPDTASATTTGIYYYDSFAGTKTFTKTTGVEIVFDKLDSTELVIGGTLRGKVVAVRNSTSVNGAIGANQFVLYASNSSSHAASLRALVAGDTVEITATENMLDARDVMENCSTAFPTYGYDIVANGENVTSTNPLGDAFNSQRAQRSGIGVKADGTVVLVATDGRGTYTGLTVYELADYFISQGCVTAIDLDGGGSTQMAVENTSGNLTQAIGFGRRVANSILVVKRPTVSDKDKTTLADLIAKASSISKKTVYLNEAIADAKAVYASSTSMPGDYTRVIMNLQDGISKAGKTNLVAGLDYTTTGSISEDYITDLTDGQAQSGGSLSDWNGWTSNGTVVFDLGKKYEIDDIRLHLMHKADYAIISPIVSVAFSNDGKNYTTSSAQFPVLSSDSSYWTQATDLGVTARYVKFTVTLNGGFGFINEIEVLGNDYDVNIVGGMDYKIEGTTGESYQTNLTDGSAPDVSTSSKGDWLGFNSDASVIFDLGEIVKLSGARVHALNRSGYGIYAAKISISTSFDGVNYTEYDGTFTSQTEDGRYWCELTDIDDVVAGRYIKVSFERTGSWAFVNEIELYGTFGLYVGADYTVETDGSAPSDKYIDDGERLTDGEKLIGDINNDKSVNGVPVFTTGYSRWTEASYVDVIVDLGAVMPTGTYSIYALSNFYGYSQPASLKIYVSNDGVTFTEAYGQIYTTEYVQDGETLGVEVSKIYKHTVSLAQLEYARYVKFSITPDSAYGFVEFDEVEITAEVNGQEACNKNLVSGLEFTSPTGTLEGALSYKADLTDGRADSYGVSGALWFGLRSSSLDATNTNTVGDRAEMVFDLGGMYDISGARIHFMNTKGSGICEPKSVKLWVSVDGVNFDKYAAFTTDSTNNACYWATLEEADGLVGRYVKVAIDMNADKANGGGGWVMLNEIEVYGDAYTIPTEIRDVDAEVKGNEVEFTVVTSPDYNGIKVTFADKLDDYIVYSTSYTVDDDGYHVYKISVPAIYGKTTYVIDGDLVGSDEFENSYYYIDVTVPVPTGIYNVTYVVDGENVIFTVTTSADFDEIKVTTDKNLSGAVSTSSDCVVDQIGYATYTITVPAINGTTKYAFDGSKGGYIGNYYYVDVTAELEIELYQSVSYEIKDDKIIFTVVTAPGDYNRIKVANANAVGTSLGVGTYTIDENGFYVWTVKTNAPTETTTFAFDLRTSANKYLKDYYMVEVEYVDTEIYKSVSYVIEGDKIVFTVVTLAGDFNRIKVANATAVGTSLGVGTYTVDENGNYVWTVKANAPKETTTFAFDLRTSEMKYLKDYHEFKVEVVETVEIFKSTSYEIVDGKVIFTAITAAGDYNRVKISLLDNITSYVKYVDTYTVDANGDYVWTLKFNAPTTVTEYALDIRVASVMKYVKDYYYVTINPVVEPESSTDFISGKGEIDGSKMILTIITKPTEINRVKVMLTSNQSSYVKLIDKYTVNADGNYVWTATIAAPGETTSYTCDVRSSVTNRYLKDYFTFEVTPAAEETEIYKSVTHEIVGDKIVFTVVTSAGNFNRIKVTTSNSLKSSLAVGSYTVDANGDYVWTVKATAPAANTSYAFDLRLADEMIYTKDYFYYDVAI